MPFVTPDADSSPAVAVSITVPAVFVSATVGALYELSLARNWEEVGDMTVDEAVAIMAAASQKIKVGEAALSTSLISAWELDESGGYRRDSHGSNHLTDNNTVGSRTAKIGAKAAEFIRANTEYLSIADNTSFDFTAGDWLFSGWFLLGDKTTTQRLITKINTNFEMQLVYQSALDRFLFQVSTNGTSATHSVIGNALGSPTANTWYNVLIQRDAAADKIGMQVNNGTLEETALASDIYDGGGIFTLGGNSAALEGGIDNVYYWRRMLTATEKAFIYNAGLGRSYLELLAYQG